jgi:hypothetical protein
MAMHISRNQISLNIYPNIPPIVIASGLCEAISALAMKGIASGWKSTGLRHDSFLLDEVRGAHWWFSQ